MPTINKETNPFLFGYTSITHKKAKIHTTVGSTADNVVVNIEKAFSYKIGYVPDGYAHRPDLISNVFYGTPAYWWLLMLANNVSDPFEGFKVDDRILIPELI